jgi:hypothetical protein
MWNINVVMRESFGTDILLTAVTRHVKSGTDVNHERAEHFRI